MKKPSERERRPLTVSEKEAVRKAHEEAEKKAEQAYSSLEKSTAEFASSEAGKEFFKALYEECGLHKSTLVTNPMTGEFVASTAFEAKRTVWLKVRKLIPHAVLVEIENPAPKSYVATAMEKI